ncbi:MAG: prepilin-type N-terminal cleavage/methylation domain-containing protein [Planctomycetota bacterium]
MQVLWGLTMEQAMETGRVNDNMATAHAGRGGPGPVRRGFTIIELLVVISIIVIVVSIITPALNGARQVARSTASQALLVDVGNSMVQFRQENAGRLPGLNTPRVMGDGDNPGLSAMENAMLELGGREQILDPRGSVVQPIWSNTGVPHNIDPDLSGVGDSVYFSPAPEVYEVVEGQWTEDGSVGNGALLPDVVDYFGRPILLWVEDSAAPEIARSVDEFASVEYLPGRSSKFYWTSNKAFLSSRSLTDRGLDQVTSSLIGGDMMSPPDSNVLPAVLGDPASPRLTAGVFAADTYPGEGRGEFVLHSAGPDGFYFGRNDNGFKRLPKGGDAMSYSFNFLDGASQRIRDETSGAETSIDLTEGFDDVLVTGG